MPFDNTNVCAEIAILDKMAELLSTEERWCKGALHKVRPGGVESRCLYGALFEAEHGYPRPYETGVGMIATSAGSAVERQLKGLLGGYRGLFGSPAIVGFNNAPETTHADILALINRARASFGGSDAV